MTEDRVLQIRCPNCKNMITNFWANGRKTINYDGTIKLVNPYLTHIKTHSLDIEPEGHMEEVDIDAEMMVICPKCRFCLVHSYSILSLDEIVEELSNFTMVAKVNGNDQQRAYPRRGQ